MNPLQREQWRVALIDDEADIREVTAIALADAGYRVETAADGKAGLDLIASIDPQIVVTDIRMPQMDGLQLLEKVKRAGSHAEVIVVTAYGEMDLAIRALRLDASDFITKPIDDDAIHLALHRAKERYRARKQVRDYTDLLERENARTARELSATIAIQKSLTANALDGIASFDRMGRMVSVNPSLVKMLAYAGEEPLRQQTLDDLMPPGGAAVFREQLADDKFGGRNRLLLYETTLATADGQLIPVQVSAVSLGEATPDIETICFFKDLREIVALEHEVADQARILHQDKMMSLGRLAASVVHEINNPLSGILNYLRLMRRILEKGPLNDDRQTKFGDYLELVERETDRCSRIVSNLLTFSRKTPPSRERIDFADLIERCVVLIRHKLELHDITISHAVADHLPPVFGDVNLLHQCIINLIFNAIDAMPNGGTLDLSVGPAADFSGAVIAVKDSGIGIANADLDRIFEPFYTTKDKGYGVGLGLSNVYGIMEGHRGSVDVKSTPGRGTTFFLRLPASDVRSTHE
jgi:PAS domain S-box-containing protein